MCRTPKNGFSNTYGPWALVTGGAVGMGEAFAELIAT